MNLFVGKYSNFWFYFSFFSIFFYDVMETINKFENKCLSSWATDKISIVGKRLLMKCGSQKVLRREDYLKRGGVFRRRIRNSHFSFSSKETLILRHCSVFLFLKQIFQPFKIWKALQKIVHLVWQTKYCKTI